MIINLANLGQGGGGEYTLPTATSTRLGGVKIGEGINVSADGTISVNGGSSDIVAYCINDLTQEQLAAIWAEYHTNLNIPANYSITYKRQEGQASFDIIGIQALAKNNYVSFFFKQNGNEATLYTNSSLRLYEDGTYEEYKGGEAYKTTEVDKMLRAKQDTLVSGTNIKTVNGNSILGEGNIEIQGGEGAESYFLDAMSQDEIKALFDKINEVYCWPEKTGNGFVGNIYYAGGGDKQTQMTSMFHPSFAADMISFSGVLSVENPVVVRCRIYSDGRLEDAGQSPLADLSNYPYKVSLNLMYKSQSKTFELSKTGLWNEVWHRVHGYDALKCVIQFKYFEAYFVDGNEYNYQCICPITITTKQGTEEYYSATWVLTAVVVRPNGDMYDLTITTDDYGFNSGFVYTFEPHSGGGGGSANIIELTQAEYDALEYKSKDAIYVISDAQIVDINDFATKTDLEAKADAMSIDEYRGVGRGDAHKFPTWNSQGVITGFESTQFIGDLCYINNTTFWPLVAFKNNFKIFAPTTSGDEGQILISAGTNKSPVFSRQKFVFISQTEYDNLEEKDATTFYFIIGD